MKALAKLAVLAALAFGSLVSMAAEESAWERVKRFAHAQKESALTEGRKLVDATDKQIAALGKDAKHATAETKAAHEKNMAELRRAREKAHAELGRMQASGADAWNATRDGFSAAYRALHQAYEKAAASARR